MVELAARLAFLGQPVDLKWLYETTDREPVLLHRAVLNRLSALHQAEVDRAGG